MLWQNTFQKCSRSETFFKIGDIVNFLIFTRKYLGWGLFSVKLQDWWPENLFKKRPQQRCFPVNITKWLRKAFFIGHIRWLLLKIVEEFLRISNRGFRGNDLYGSTNLKVWSAKSWQLFALRFVWYDFKKMSSNFWDL